MTRHILVVLGTRPEAIKLAPVIHTLRERANARVSVCSTGQHRELLIPILDAFSITPDVSLSLMDGLSSLHEVYANALLLLFPVIQRLDPDVVLVQGDTTTAFMGAFGAFLARKAIGHVEAGLRTGCLDAPWPEEGNRAMISKLAKWHFAPTKMAGDNLLKEGIDTNSIYITGNTVVDALTTVRNEILRDGTKEFEFWKLHHRIAYYPKLVLVTGHRRESFGEGFQNICSAIATLASRFPETAFVYPVHLNPNVREPVNRILGCKDNANIFLLPPIGYLELLILLKRCHFVLTDSGGIQEEAPSFNKPVLVMRDSTERGEAVELNIARLVGTSEARIVEWATILLTDPTVYAGMKKAENPFGDGLAASRICDILLNVD